MTHFAQRAGLVLLLIGTAVSGQPRQQDADWGDPVKGVQCRLRAADSSEGAARILFVDIRNVGNTTLYVWQTQEAGFELRVDGIWYRWLGDVDAKSSSFPPGRTYTNIRFDLSAGGWHLGLQPGNHVVQVAVLPLSRSSCTADIRALSREVTVTVGMTQE
jgi:hypothetical protein